MRRAILAALLAASLPATADGMRLPPGETYKTECGSCHVAYPPQLLPESAWRQLMSRLERHFGGDASLDAKAHAEISRFLAAHAGRRPAPAGAEPRITATRWFRREHDEVPVARWKDPAVGSAANCGACHTRAAEGVYED
jgi:hypothetical protein